MKGPVPAGGRAAPVAWRLALAVVIAGGCSSPSPLAVPRLDAITVEGAIVVWSTSEPTVGSVRYGRSPGAYRAVAYPAAAQRADRTPAREHRVRLLDVAGGDTVYLQVLQRSALGTLVVSAEHRFVIAAGVTVPPRLAWTMIDVGFGDAHLLTMPATGERVLIDAGERRDWANVARFLQAASVTRLDAVLATHIHEDHIGGMVGESATLADGVLGAIDVGAFLEGPNHSGSRTAYDELVATLAGRGIPRRLVRVGETHATNPALAWDPGVGVEILNAGGGRAIGGSGEGDWINNDSVVMRVSFGQVDLMLGGDAESPVQTRIVTLHPQRLESEVLKVHHHGLHDASDPAWLGAVNPRVGLIPIATYESYAGTLPSTVVLDRLRARMADIFCSDRAEPLGIALTGDAGIDVTVLTDGAGYEVSVAPSASRHWPGEWTDGGTAAVRGGERP